MKKIQSSIELCTACFRPLVQVTYQARSADEPARSTTFCRACPLDPRKLNPGDLVYKADYGKGTPRPRRAKTDTTVSRLEPLARTIRVVGTFSTCRADVPPLPNIDMHDVLVRKVDCRIESRGSDLRVCCLLEEDIETGQVEISRTPLCPGVFLAQIVTCRIPALDSARPHYRVRASRNHNAHDLELDVRSWSPDHYEFSMQVDEASDPRVSSFVRVLYHYGLCPTTLDMCWGYGKTRSLLCAKPRAHDVGAIREADHLITSKPDGQRCLVVRLGIVWAYFTSDVRADLIGWIVSNHPSHEMKCGAVGAVMDAELMLGQSPVFIDLLQRDDGSQMPENRRVAEVIATAREVPGVEEAVQFRSYFSSLVEAESYCLKAGYPCDGMVAISKDGVEMKKLKPHKSIELRHAGDGCLVSNEGTTVVTIEAAKRFDLDAIIEVRFQADVLGPTHKVRVGLTCSDMFERSDKTKANSTEVCIQIIKLAAGLQSGPSMVRRLCMLWCCKVKEHVLRTALTMCKDKRVIIDLGSGNGQSTGLYSQVLGDSWSKTVLFIENDTSRATQLARSLRRLRTRTVGDPDLLLTHMALLRNGGLDAVICTCDANSLFESPKLISEVQKTVGCVVSNFSATHVLPAIELLMESKLKMVGCTYLYDGVSAGSALVDNGDIVMKITSSDTAVVKWGNDAEYTERPITSSDLKDYAVVRKATSCVPLTAESTDSSIAHECVNVCSKVFVFQRS